MGIKTINVNGDEERHVYSSLVVDNIIMIIAYSALQKFLAGNQILCNYYEAEHETFCGGVNSCPHDLLKSV